MIRKGVGWNCIRGLDLTPVSTAARDFDSRAGPTRDFIQSPLKNKYLHKAALSVIYSVRVSRTNGRKK
jgi:hypothetical protein